MGELEPRPISASALAVAAQCDLYTVLRYGFEIEPVGETLPLRYGSAVHLGLETYLRACIGHTLTNTQHAELREAAGDAAARYLEESGVEFDPTRNPDNARAVVTNWVDEWHATLRDYYQVVAVEQDFVVTLEGVTYTGRIDAVWRGVEGAHGRDMLVVVDHKTSNRPPDWQTRAQWENDAQLSLYVAAQRALLPAGESLTVSACVNHLSSSPGARSRLYWYGRTASQLAALLRYTAPALAQKLREAPALAAPYYEDPFAVASIVHHLPRQGMANGACAKCPWREVYCRAGTPYVKRGAYTRRA